MIASLPMYWRAETEAYWQAYWKQVRTTARDFDLALPPLVPPEQLPQDLMAHWLDPRLALSMTCGLPFRTALKDKVAYVGTLDFGLGTPIGHYQSEAILRKGCDLMSPEGIVLAFNAPDSQSGWAAAQEAPPFDKTPTRRATLCTGSHAESLAAVAGGHADLAYIDAVTWRMLRAYDPVSQQVIAAGQTRATPGLPLIAASDAPLSTMRAVLARATSQFATQAPRSPFAPMSFHVLNPQAYYAIPVPPPPDPALAKTP